MSLNTKKIKIKVSAFHFMPSMFFLSLVFFGALFFGQKAFAADQISPPSVTPPSGPISSIINVGMSTFIKGASICYTFADGGDIPTDPLMTTTTMQEQNDRGGTPTICVPDKTTSATSRLGFGFEVSGASSRTFKAITTFDGQASSVVMRSYPMSAQYARDVVVSNTTTTSATATANIYGGINGIDKRGFIYTQAYSFAHMYSPGNNEPGSVSRFYVEESGPFESSTFSMALNTGNSGPLIPNTRYFIIPYIHNDAGYVYGTYGIFQTASVDGSSAKSINSFNLLDLNPQVMGVVNESDHTIALTVPAGTDMGYPHPVPTIVHTGVSIYPDPKAAYFKNGQFPKLYTVKAQDGSIQSYTVVITVSDAVASITAGDANAAVTITPPSSNGGITGYTVTSFPAGGVDNSAGTGGLYHFITGLTNGVSYTFTVNATNADGTKSVLSSLGNVIPSNAASEALSSGANSTSLASRFNYQLLESFPGFFTAGQSLTDFPALILAIYKFGIWTVGIAGLFMLVVGGFMYMASAGNTSTASNARSIISDAILGIVAALAAYLILYVINPDLTVMKIGFTTVSVSDAEDVQVSGTMSGSLTNRNGKQIDVSFANALDKIKLAGTDAIVTSGLRSVEEQKAQIVANCGGFPPTKTCIPSTCLLKNGPSSCPHTTGMAADIWALNTSGGQAIGSRSQCLANLQACFNNPKQKALIDGMRAEGFCVLSTEPWHFEKPKMSSSCT